MNGTQGKQYLDDVPKDIQDLLFEDRGAEAVQLLMDQKGLGKMQAEMETGRIAARMNQESPLAVPSGIGLNGKHLAIALWAFIALFLLVGAVLTTIGIHGLSLGFASRNWPNTEARILQSEVESVRSGRSTKVRTIYRARVSYEFIVDGVTYKGDRVAAADLGRKKSEHAKRIVKRYPKGSNTSVYYMPENPGKCLLEPGFQGKTFIIPAVGLFVLLLGGVFLAVQISVIRDERKQRNNLL